MTPCPDASSHVHCPQPHWVHFSPFPARTRPSQSRWHRQVDGLARRPDRPSRRVPARGHRDRRTRHRATSAHWRTATSTPPTSGPAMARSISEGPGTPAAGLKVDQRGRLFVSGGTSGTARVVDTDTGETLVTYSSGDRRDVHQRRRRHARRRVVHRQPAGGALQGAARPRRCPSGRRRLASSSRSRASGNRCRASTPTASRRPPTTRPCSSCSRRPGCSSGSTPTTGAATVVDLGGYLADERRRTPRRRPHALRRAEPAQPGGRDPPRCAGHERCARRRR